MLRTLMGFGFLIIIGACAVGCAPAPAVTAPTDTLPPATEIPLATATEEAAPQDTETPEPTEIVITLDLDSGHSSCVPIGDHDPLPEVAYQEYPAAILDYLNQGASPEELAAELILRGLGPSEQPVRTEDLSRDGYRDVVVSIYDLQTEPKGGMLIYTCAEDAYVLSYISLAEGDEHAPEALLIQDLDADGFPEMVFTITICDSHTCFDDVEILSWENGAFVERVEGATTDLPNPSAQLTDYDRDGVYSLEVVGKAFSDVEAGPQRDKTSTWEYDPGDGMWKYADYSLAASPFRIHLVHDADDAMRRGEYQIGSLLFQQVLEDEDLIDWLNPAEEALNLGAYAYFKRVVAAGFLAQIGQGEALLDEMGEAYPDYPQTAYVAMADAFWTEFTSSGSAQEGCYAAHQFAVLNQAAVLTPLGSKTYGYANRDYTPTDICP
jgi:hypothetical protein